MKSFNRLAPLRDCLAGRCHKERMWLSGRVLEMQNLLVGINHDIKGPLRELSRCLLNFRRESNDPVALAERLPSWLDRAEHALHRIRALDELLNGLYEGFEHPEKPLPLLEDLRAIARRWRGSPPLSLDLQEEQQAGPVCVELTRRELEFTLFSLSVDARVAGATHLTCVSTCLKEGCFVELTLTSDGERRGGRLGLDFARSIIRPRGGDIERHFEWDRAHYSYKITLPLRDPPD